MIHSAFLWFRESLRHPEWIAAYALSVQIFIFAWQARILRRHAGTLEEHTAIAARQEQTAKLIGEALTQQGKIMASQFNFQKQLEAQAERKTMFDLIIRLLASVSSLTSKLNASTLGTAQEVEEIRRVWSDMENNATACRMALIVSEHLSEDETNHFVDYLHDLHGLKQTNMSRNDYQQLERFNDRHKDFLTILGKNRDAAVKAITSGT